LTGRSSKGKLREQLKEQLEEGSLSSGRITPKLRVGLGLSADPDTYLQAKKKLKKAIIEHYRLLEMLQNYRVGLRRR
jgi:hypothetical protein